MISASPRALQPLIQLTAQDRSDRLTLDQYLEWEQVSDPQISPDGQQIVYTRCWIDKMNDSWESSLWTMNVDGTRNRFLMNGSSARWSPDGTRLAFLQQGDPEGNQIFVRWMDAEGATMQVTRVDQAPGGIGCLPDGESIAFTMRVPSAESWRVKLPGRPEGAKWTTDPKVVTHLNYRRDRRGYIDDGYQHIFVVTATGGTPRRVTSCT